MYLVDTDVISALRRADRAPLVASWFGGVAEDDLYLSVVTLGEIARGISLQERKNPDFAADLTTWLTRTRTLYADRIVAFDAEAAEVWGRLSARLGHPGADLMIAATALVRGATVVTMNDADFIPTGVPTLNPTA